MMQFILKVNSVESLGIIEALRDYINDEEKNEIDRTIAKDLLDKINMQIYEQYPGYKVNNIYGKEDETFGGWKGEN